jgi:hypothetical protein
VTDRDLRARLPEIELQQLAGPIDGALIGPAALKQRPDLAQIVIEDRLSLDPPIRSRELAGWGLDCWWGVCRWS